MDRRSAIKLASALPLLASHELRAKDEFSESKFTEGEAKMKVQRLPWAGIKVVVNSTTLFVDASAEDGFTVVSETQNCNALVTHHHGDHYDQALLKNLLNERSQFACFDEVAPWIDSRPFKTQSVKLNEPIFFPRAGSDIIATAVPAVDGFGHPQVSWIIQGGGKKIIHCGDTLWHGHWWSIGAAYGPFDVAFMPINGFRQVSGRYTDSGIPMSLTPQQAVAAAKTLNAKVACPIHYGRPSTNYFEVKDPEGTFIKSAASSNLTTQIMRPGEWIKW
jgi:L-ascorbate metabolism protein UlaG (beta-lactamase superfamily)